MKGKKTILIIGAGEAGGMLTREIIKHPELGYFPVGFIDDDQSKKGLRLWGLPVLGDRNDFLQIVKEKKIDLVFIAIPSAPGDVIRLYVDLAKKAQVPFKIVPGVYELIDGNVKVEMVREVKLDDLLRRAPVKINLEEIASYIYQKRVLITGAGGSIGSELARQVLQYGPSTLYLLGHGENSIYYVDLELRELFPHLDIRPVIADIQDTKKMEFLFSREKPQVVFHAAAHKHVHFMEIYPEEAVKNNVKGTLNLIQASFKAPVEKFINISTDKAVNPASAYGASKRMGEILCTSWARKTGLPYVTVRFGNVLGTHGSVIPLFQRQIKRGGPVTITHPMMSRYFMTMGEAVQLIIQAGALGANGEIFILDMGEPLKIIDLAEELIRLSGLEPHRDIRIENCGVRPGEKLEEELFEENESLVETGRERILKITNPLYIPWKTLKPMVEELLKAASEINRNRIYEIFKRIIPSMNEVEEK
ncbi:MAG: polysaccharide biosynthesis protein [Caldiserica bacterium]|jgi:FlaA1/EpsC-like NDP-sugar epimerase|nr:polysaccharide biosynthesis protein [Caldisericota bacterium]